MMTDVERQRSGGGCAKDELEHKVKWELANTRTQGESCIESIFINEGHTSVGPKRLHRGCDNLFWSASGRV